MCKKCTCAESEAGLFAHVAQADGDAVSSAGLQAFQLVLHRVVLGRQLVVPLQLADRVPHVDRIGLQAHSHPERDRERGGTGRRAVMASLPGSNVPVSTHENIGFDFHPVPSPLQQHGVPEGRSGSRRAAATSAWPGSCPLARDGGSWAAASRWGSFSPRRSRREDPGRERWRAPEGKTQQ